MGAPGIADWYPRQAARARARRRLKLAAYVLGPAMLALGVSLSW